MRIRRRAQLWKLPEKSGKLPMQASMREAMQDSELQKVYKARLQIP